MLRRMGAWDVTPFANDAAADWASDLIDAPEPETFLSATLQLADRRGYLDASDGSQAVAAAAVVAAACGAAPGGFPSELTAWLHGKETRFRQFAPEALAAVRRVRGEESELRELWETSEDFAAWSKTLEAIAAALR
jgi:hypothetical protein